MAKIILIVDDSMTMRQLVTFALKDAGYAVMEAVNGKDALKKVDTAKVDMVITDLNMPEMGGTDLIRELRKKPTYRFTPIVMLTTESQEAKKQEGKQAGASAWVVKPFTPKGLTDLIGKFVK